MKIIVNADDLGISKEVNDAVFEGMQRGTITSATMLSNGPYVREAAQSLLRFPNCSFGVHLNLTQFEPLCQESYADLASLLDENGRFNRNAIHTVKITPPLRRAVFREWSAQIENLMRLGVEPSHLDAHHHVHTIPQLLPVLVALRRRYKINRARTTRTVHNVALRPAQLVLSENRLFNMALRTMGFRTTGLFTDLGTFISQCADQPPGRRPRNS